MTANTTSQAPSPRNDLHRKRARASLARRGLAALVALGGLAWLIWAFLPKPLAVDIAQVRRDTLRVTIDEDGKTRVKDRFVVSSPLLANVARIELSPGDAVTPETVVLRLLPLAPPLLDTRSRAEAQARVDAASAAERQAHAAIARVRAAAQFAEREVVRLRALRDRGAAAEQAVEQAEVEARTLREELASAEFGAKVADHGLVLARTALGVLGRGAIDTREPLEVRSPIAGRVLRILQESEGVVQPGAPLIELGDPAALEIVLDVLTSDAVQIRPGTPATIDRWGGSQVLPAHVRTIEPSAFTRLSALGVEEQRVNVVLDLDAPRDQWAMLGDGYRVEATLLLWQADDALVVPSSAVFRRGGGQAAFRVSDGRALLTPLRTGRFNDELFEVLSGVGAGDTVILHPSDRVQDGTAVVKR